MDHDLSTLDNLENLLDSIEIQNVIFKTNLPVLLNKAKKLVEISQQYEYQIASKFQGSIPVGISSQSKFRCSVNNNPLQDQLQNLYNFTASRALDMIIKDTKSRRTSAKNLFYHCLQKMKATCEREEIDFSSIDVKIKNTMARQKK